MAHSIALSIPVPQGASRYRILALLQALDVATTWYILDQFTHRAEGNPVVATLIANSGLPVAMLFLLVVKLSVVQVLHSKGTGVNLISGVYGLVVFNNLLALVLTLV